MEYKVETRGIAELKKALKQIDKQLPLELKSGFARIAENVASKIRPKVPKRVGDARASVKARGSQRGGAIAFGGSKAPYYPWLDFGGRVGRNRSITRSFFKEGRYVYPTIKQEQNNIIRETDELMANLAEKAGFEVRGGE